MNAKGLTYAQRAVLNFLRTRTMGAVLVAGRYVWPDDIRCSRRLAEAVYAELFAF